MKVSSDNMKTAGNEIRLLRTKNIFDCFDLEYHEPPSIKV